MKPKPSSVALLLDTLGTLVQGMAEPLLNKLAEEYQHNPFIILIGCLLSLRTRDTVTYKICKTLFARAKTPKQLLAIPVEELEKIIYSVNYYSRKARVLRAVSQELLDRFDGKVPSDEKELLSLPGVGRKTANLVRAEAFNIPALGVDTHVHQLANKLGLVSTKTPEATEQELKKIIPRDRWREAHRLLVMCGQNRCDITPLKHLFKSNGHA